MIEMKRLCKAAGLAAISGLMSATGAFADSPPADTGTLEEIVVTGVRASEQRSVELKRNADMIQDSISAEDIGKLPDTTIADSLQRITGVQINREGGEGTSVNVRGLPEVGTLLNGEAFLTAGSIVSVQPDFGDIPSQLFSGADVNKSPTASLLNAGITGTINLKTRRPFDLQQGWTVAGAASALHGSQTDKYQPELDTLIGYHADRWGIVASAAYSDVTLEHSFDGMGQYSGELVSESSDNTVGDTGFLGAFNGGPIPSGITLLHPANCIYGGNPDDPTHYFDTSSDGHGCDVDVNGDGKANGVFYNTADYAAIDEQIEKKRLGFNLSLQADLGSGFKLISDMFYTNQKSYDRQTGYQLNSANWDGASFIPLTARNTGVQVYDGYNGADSGAPLADFYVTSSRQFYIGDIETYSDDNVTKTQSRNFNLQLSYDNGGQFTGEVRAIHASASALHMESYLQYALSDGTIWKNDPVDAPQDPAHPNNYAYATPDGPRVFNPYGIAPNTVPAAINFGGDHLGITLPPALLATMQNPDAYALKTVTSEGDYDRSSTMDVLRADGHYKFADRNLRLDFGLRQGNRTADNENFALIAPVYAGLAYYNPVDPVTGEEDLSTRIPVPDGCYQHYKAGDIVLDGQGIAGACKAGDPVTGFYRANPLVGLNPSQLGAMIANNTRLYNHLADVQGISVNALDPKIMDDVLAFQNALYPGEIRDHDPAGTWKVKVNQTTGYLQANFSGNGSHPFGANVGVKLIRTELGIDQHSVSPDAVAYYVNPHDGGIIHTDRSFTDVLPVANLFVDLTPKLKLRAAFSKNMQLLDLDQWGGGLTLNYAFTAGPPAVFAVYGGQQGGNPNLDPWRSTNYDLSLEYYISRSSMLSIAAFYVDVASFIAQAGTTRCDLPDQDGVVRNRCVGISGPSQGSGKSLHGLEFGWKQAFDFLPGKLANTGVDVNFTYSPSNVGTDVAGNTIPFQENSKEQANLILWYQGNGFEARVAGNYRSKRAVEQDYGGITGFEEYQEPTFYLDASASYSFAKHFQVFIDGSNLTGEKEKYYLVWPDMKLNTTQFETRYALGVRAKF
ncbi:MAG TPA: TonB-dependent receptor [Steroidobacteraceae bacterium]|nr:TonB-dependent receptor [Steroidobacteraceae bacterium]